MTLLTARQQQTSSLYTIGASTGMVKSEGPILLQYGSAIFLTLFYLAGTHRGKIFRLAALHSTVQPIRATV
ncbi:hypothetical protein BDV27DRAFT_170453 [Aspergillus caelatus]|uniref:Uncharacterized protein n=1 Tax=Aspergillus caelatus TaxID=61420 RepID=A0A5N6ZIR9_9EURO|nr:uncharacterized protein BDV27DRAFT_170453 [Aspergillus caelatus]KAE8357527.1 hypothetical protein BDV27DRAFT_170453 [Aspergillus caelatus]